MVKWVKEHTSLLIESEETNTDLENVWVVRMEEPFLQDEELKEEPNYLYPTSQDTKDDTFIVLYVKVLLFKVTPFFWHAYT